MVLRDASIAHLKIRGRVFSYFVIMGVFFLLLFCSTLETVWSTCFAKMWLASQITKYIYSTAMKIFGSQDKRVFFEEEKILEDTNYPQRKLFLLILHGALPEGSSFSYSWHLRTPIAKLWWPVLLLNSGCSCASKLRSHVFPHFLLSLWQSSDTDLLIQICVRCPVDPKNSWLAPSLSPQSPALYFSSHNDGREGNYSYD